ncbi:Trehalose utilization [Planctomycetes bacterium Pan216]|uniref:Trehalose utilization n=1 Tax=Kolteria novifilia TaxID=2527975 RepID=A0A518AXB7_9BACT|nr:Trehalose utilization [Planctomycetes bacterium Pan216]
MRRRTWLLCVWSLGLVLTLTGMGEGAEKLKALIVDGQNNHKWQQTTPIIKKSLEDSGRFTVDVVTAPPKGSDLSSFKPTFADYDVVVSNYNGAPWPEETQEAFEDYVKGGGGFVSVHAANNSFPKWPEYNEMIALGGWGGRTEKDGPYIRYREGKVVRDNSAGRGGSHGARHEFVVETRDADHPIMKGLPTAWRHTPDELYDRLRGPAKNLSVLATAYSDPKTGGTGEHEPILMTIDYGKGRVFHTTLGHDTKSMNCAGFQSTLNRGTEWAATGKVTQKVPKDFPGSEKTSPRS